MEKNLIFLKPLTGELGKLLERLSIDSEYEVFEIDDISELSQTLPILEQSFVLNGDLKVTRQYLGDLKQFTTSIDCFILLASDKDVPPHILKSLKSMGLNEMVGTSETSDVLLKKISDFFEEGYQGPDLDEKNVTVGELTQIKWSKSENNNEEWKVQHTLKKQDKGTENRLKGISNNISTLEKNRIERLLNQLNEEEKSATLTKLKKGFQKFSFKKDLQDYQELKKRFVGRKVDGIDDLEGTKAVGKEFNANLSDPEVKSFELELKSKEERTHGEKTIKEKSIEQELEAQISEEKSLDEMGLEISREIFEESKFDTNEKDGDQNPYYNEDEEPKVLEGYQSYEEKEYARSRDGKFEEISFKRGEGTASFYDVIKDESEEQRDDFVVKSQLNSDNPFLKNLGDEIPLELIELESKKEVDIVFPVKNDFLYIVGLSTVLGNELPHHQKVLMYINFVLNRKFEGVYVPFVISNKKRKRLLSPWGLEAFKNTFSECEAVVDENIIALEEYSIPHFDVYNDWGVFVYPYFWERNRCGLGLMLTKKTLSERDKKFVELNMLCARNVIFEESLKC